jgi:ribosome-binding ATPase YchF (GTP1/OBG family)
LSNKNINLGLAAILLSLIVIFFLSQNYILDKDNKLENTLLAISEAAQQEDWNSAESSLNNVSNLWNKGKYLVALNNGEQDYSNMGDAVEKLKGAIKVKDKNKSVETSQQIIGYWKNFRKIIPEP